MTLFNWKVCMPGKKVTQQQVKIYMNYRNKTYLTQNPNTDLENDKMSKPLLL